jgi:hypothetical protein
MEITLDKASVSERRQAIFEKMQARYLAAGIILDDPEYLALIRKWIDGEVTMPHAAEEWDGILKGRVPIRT